MDKIEQLKQQKQYEAYVKKKTAQCVVQHDEGILPWWNDLPDRTMYLSFL